MTEFSGDFIRLIEKLLPGFLVAWMVYGLTTCSRPKPFERVIQALIYSIFVRVLVVPVEHLALAIGSRWRALGTWTDDSTLVTSIIVSLAIGLVAVWCVNNDFPLSHLRPRKPEANASLSRWHRAMNRIRLTEKSITPSEWYSAFSEQSCYVVLHLDGARRLCGWPAHYPDNPESGHFLLTNAAWLKDDSSEVLLDTVASILVRARDVEIVEFLTEPDATGANRNEVEHNVAGVPYGDHPRREKGMPE